MKLMENWKRFWTLNRHHAAGFTLVELIVVIAILAILAGVAVPAYSGYIAQANKAADEQLLATINQAYATACIQSNVDITKLDSTTADIALVDGKVNLDSVKPDAVKGAFAQFYAGNEDSAFKVFSALVFDSATHSFVADADMVKVPYGGGYVYLSKEAVEKLTNSAFGTNMGSEVLLDRVDYVSRLAASLTGGGNTLEQILMSEQALSSLAVALGASSDEELETALETLAADRVAKMTGEEYEGMSHTEKMILAQKEILANNAVLQAAQNIQGKSEDELLATMKNTSNFKALIESDPEAGMSQAAMAYGMYTAYAYSLPEGTDRDAALAAVNDPSTLLGAMNDPGFTAYLGTDAAKTDLQGYLSAMEMVNNSTANNKEAVSSVLVNGFEDPALLALLQEAMGK